MVDDEQAGISKGGADMMLSVRAARCWTGRRSSVWTRTRMSLRKPQAPTILPPDVRSSMASVGRSLKAGDDGTVQPIGGHPVAHALLGARNDRANRLPQLPERRSLLGAENLGEVVIDLRHDGSSPSDDPDSVRAASRS